MKHPASDARALDAEASPTVEDDLDVEPDADLDSDAPAPSPEAAAAEEPLALSERELQILAFESKWWKHAGSKEQAIRDEFDLSATRYYQLLNGLLDNPAALAQDPVLIGRLRRIRSTRARTRRR
ncbi:DUF3263 domain-containing protein [Phytohabitans houttuyneae]|uniref:DUF3263 domain-containing protein n=1 Tax=Phytohabitans houttuyneae TaxID=1076126 RepID=A0A6V8K917_9ACTN|nr:DUF3263 domain-containing protein [Phytohabitans houttuyneae]GFJ80254.1 hypothetical protein Phou_044340 [Phytohabitans houttuyneae]